MQSVVNNLQRNISTVGRKQASSLSPHGDTEEATQQHANYLALFSTPRSCTNPSNQDQVCNQVIICRGFTKGTKEKPTHDNVRSSNNATQNTKSLKIASGINFHRRLLLGRAICEVVVHHQIVSPELHLSSLDVSSAPVCATSCFAATRRNPPMVNLIHEKHVKSPRNRRQLCCKQHWKADDTVPSHSNSSSRVLSYCVPTKGVGV